MFDSNLVQNVFFYQTGVSMYVWGVLIKCFLEKDSVLHHFGVAKENLEGCSAALSF
jgi:hypothetical protein